MDAPLAAGNWQVIGRRPCRWSPENQVPREMNRADMDKVRDDYVRAAQMAVRVPASIGWSCTTPTAT